MPFDPFNPLFQWPAGLDSRPKTIPKSSQAETDKTPYLIQALPPMQRALWDRGATQSAESPPSPPTGLPGDPRGIPQQQPNPSLSQPQQSPQQVNTQPQNDSWKLLAPPGATFEEFLKGGPGALFGSPQPGWNLGDAIGGAGVALMARDNPKAAEVLSEQMQAQRFKPPGQYWYDGQRGMIVHADHKGNVTTHQSGQPQPKTTGQMLSNGMNVIKDASGRVIDQQQVYDPPDKPIPVQVAKLFDDYNSRGDSAHNAVVRNNEFIRLLQEGNLDLSAPARLGADWRTLTNSSDERTRNAARFYSHLENLRNAKLLEAKGVQTEGDAERAMSSMLPGNAPLDNKTVATLLKQMNSGFESAWLRHNRQRQDLSAQYPSYDPTGYYRSQHETRWRDYDAEKARIDKGWGNYLSPPQQAPATSATPVTGVNPARRPTNDRGETLLEFSNRRDRERDR